MTTFSCKSKKIQNNKQVFSTLGILLPVNSYYIIPRKTKTEDHIPGHYILIE